MAGERIFQWSVETYAAGLRWVLRHQPFMLAVTGATICLSVYLYIVIPKGFFPQQDTGLIDGNILGAQDISFPAMQEETEAIHRHRHERSGGREHVRRYAAAARKIPAACRSN